jgi:hypothetical protein
MPAAVGMQFGRYELLEALGDRDAASRCLDSAFRAGYSRDEIERDPSLKRLRADPRRRNLGKGEPTTVARKHR